MGKKEMEQLLEERPDLRQELFIRGFLVTDQSPDPENYPFYGQWNVSEHAGYRFYTHPLTGFHVWQSGNKAFFLLGHAYDPFRMEMNEERILKGIAKVFPTDAWLERVNDLTGVFVFGICTEGKIEFLTDPSGMQSACYSLTEKGFYLSSHPQLIGDLCGFTMDSFVEELIHYKWYGRVMGPYLPADLTPFKEVKRIVPDIRYHAAETITHRRFWPAKPALPVKNEEEYGQVIREAADILKNNMLLISRKWDKPWISLTGGIDSNTTFAAANGIYDRFEAFSYISAEKEIQDAEAAKTIAERFLVPHHVYRIPSSNDEIEDYDAIRKVLMHNNGYVAETKDNEIRKRIWLRRHAECDVEVKSWGSETIRAYWYKHYGRKTMPPLSAKLFRNLYKIFILDRKLAHKVDKVFAEYIREFGYRDIPDGYPAADMHYNEVTWGSWGGLNISEMKYCFDITFAYNNRRFFDLMFRIPLEDRISDRHHLEMKKVLNRDLYDMNIRVVNLHETDFRARALNVIFTLNMLLPF